MKGSFVFLSFVVSLAIAIAQEDVADVVIDETNVLKLTEKNFTTVIENNEFVLVEFYASWCGFCKSLAPEYAKAADKLAALESPIKIAKVDAIEEKELAKSHNVQGFPTINFFMNKVSKAFNGKRSADDIVAWVIRNSGAPTTTVDKLDEAKKLIENDYDQVVIMGYFESSDSTEAKAYLAAAENLFDSFTCGITTNKEVIEGMKADVNSIVTYKKFEKEKGIYSGDWTVESVTTFIQGEEFPLVVNYTTELVIRVFQGNIKTKLFILFPSSSDKTKSYFEDFRAVAKDFRGKILFAYVDTEGPDGEDFMMYFAVKKDDLPAMVLTDGEMNYFPGTLGIDQKSIRMFCDDYLSDKLQPQYKSEEIPEDWNKESVTVLVGKNFEEVALDQSKHVFVEFYAPWCGHCKQLAPIWEELGEHFKNNDDIVIAKMDATQNEVPELKIQGFPTLKFFPKGSEDIVDYDGPGERTLNDLIQFVERQVNGESYKGPSEPIKEANEEPLKDEL